MDVNDPQGHKKKLERQRQLLMNADIPNKDKEAIKEFFINEAANTNNTDGTLANDLKNLRLAADRAATPLMEMEMEDVDEFTVVLERDYDLAPKTIHGYRRCLRKFFKYHDREWAEDITLADIDKNEVDPTKLFDEDEIESLLDKADNARMKALIAILADTGLRVGAVCSMRLSDVDMDGKIATVTINEEGNVKGASGTVPLTFSRAHVANYLEVHPRRDDDSAAFIHKKTHYGPDDDGAVKPSYLREKLKKLGEEIGIDRDRLTLHNFRHTAVSRWILEGLSHEVIKHRAGWADGTDMMKVYNQITDDQMNEKIAVDYGLVDPEDLDDNHDTETAVKECDICGTDLHANARYCPGCGNPVSTEAAHEEAPPGVKDPDETADAVSELDGVLSEMEAGTVLSKLLTNHPELLDDVDLPDEDAPS